VLEQRETTMMFAEIIHSCTKEKLDEAAVASISASFARDIQSVAEARDMVVGEYAAGLVRRFHWRASDADRLALSRAMMRSQTPVLAGLRHILEAMMGDEAVEAAQCRAMTSRTRVSEACHSAV
jgi:hypothetical protein